MITNDEIDDLLFNRLGLTRNQRIKGIQLWNHLIDRGFFSQLEYFAALNWTPSFFLPESLISEDPVAQSVFNKEFYQLDPQIKKVFNGDFKISELALDFSVSSKGKVYRIIGRDYSEETGHSFNLFILNIVSY